MKSDRVYARKVELEMNRFLKEEKKQLKNVTSRHFTPIESNRSQIDNVQSNGGPNTNQELASMFNPGIINNLKFLPTTPEAEPG